MRFSSDQMKSRATRKVDIGSFMKTLDIKGTVISTILIDPKGHVACIKTMHTHPILQLEVERALKKWQFKPATVKDHSVAYLGVLQFKLCNINCGSDGMSMSIVK